MKTLRKRLASIRWKELRDAAAVLLMLAGGCAGYELFHSPRPWWSEGCLVLAAIALYVLAFWALCGTRDALAELRSAQESRRREERWRGDHHRRPSTSTPEMRSRFLYFDAETGDEVRKLEPVN